MGRAISESLYMNAARRGGRDIYETLADGRTVSVHPGSLLAPFGERNRHQSWTFLKFPPNMSAHVCVRVWFFARFVSVYTHRYLGCMSTPYLGVRTLLRAQKPCLARCGNVNTRDMILTECARVFLWATHTQTHAPHACTLTCSTCMHTHVLHMHVHAHTPSG